jgi:hypothetical protein
MIISDGAHPLNREFMNNKGIDRRAADFLLDNFPDFVYITYKGSSFRAGYLTPRGPASTGMAA